MIAEGLVKLGFVPLADFVCRDDGDGPYIETWLSARPQPSPAEIAAATPSALDSLKAQLYAEIDGAAERTRLRFITPGAGQAMEYQAAAEEAVLAQAETDPAPETYPMLAASIGIDVDPDTGTPATDVAGVARNVLAAQGAWAVVGAAIRCIRLGGKASVNTAADEGLAHAAAAQALASLAQIGG